MTPNLKAMFRPHMGAPAGGAPAAPGQGPPPAQGSVMPAQTPTQPFHVMAKKFGLGHLKLDKNPVVARTQLMQHLQQQYGPGYMAHPGVSDLLASFNGQSGGPSQHEQNAMASQGQRTVKTLLGG